MIDVDNDPLITDHFLAEALIRARLEAELEALTGTLETPEGMTEPYVLDNLD